MIHRESAWDDETRERALALADYQAGMCGCGCGLPATESHKKQPFRVHAVTCYAGAATDKIRREAAEKPEHKDRTGWDDGLHYYAVPAVAETRQDGVSSGD